MNEIKCIAYQATEGKESLVVVDDLQAEGIEGCVVHIANIAYRFDLTNLSALIAHLTYVARTQHEAVGDEYVRP